MSTGLPVNLHAELLAHLILAKQVPVQGDTYCLSANGERSIEGSYTVTDYLLHRMPRIKDVIVTHQRNPSTMTQEYHYKIVLDF